jgi:hypothetical protein
MKIKGASLANTDINEAGYFWVTMFVCANRSSNISLHFEYGYCFRNQWAPLSDLVCTRCDTCMKLKVKNLTIRNWRLYTLFRFSEKDTYSDTS